MGITIYFYLIFSKIKFNYMENRNSTFKQASEGWIIAGFIFAILGGLLGIVIGINYTLGNYDRKTKNKGWMMIIAGIIMGAIWRSVVVA